MIRTTRSPSMPAALPLAAAALGLVVPLAMLIMARATGGPFAFPVDDAWIHLQYARNLADHGAFSYFPGDHTTTGSTAPLFTLLEAVAFKLTRNEFVIGLGLGLAAHALFLWTFARWAMRRLGHAGWAALAVALVALDGRFGMLAASGMETSLFLAGIALAFHAWSDDDARGAGGALGLALWVRPEAWLLAGVFAVDAVVARRRPRRLAAGLIAFVALASGYAIFNYATGGDAFPNTLAAKAAFYAGRSLATFAGEDLAATFSAAWLVLLPFALIHAGRGLWRAFKRTATDKPAADLRPAAAIAEAAWLVALPLAYAVVLPFSHRFNRYLVPALPALAIAGVAGWRSGLATAAGRLRTAKDRGRSSPFAAVAVVPALALLGLQAFFFAPSLAEYGAISRYHAARHVQAGRWLAAHSPPGAVIATHDVGAIAFYSGRRIVDMVGLVSPEVVTHLNRPDYLPYLAQLFSAKGVTHLAVLEEWQAVDNATPLFEATPEPEVLHIYAWRPGVTHLLASETAARLVAAREALAHRDFATAEVNARDALARDSLSASAWVWLGIAEAETGQPAGAGNALRRALALYPESPLASRWLDRLAPATRSAP